MEYDASGAASIWARGAGYKANFDARGTRYIPRLGPRAAQDFPVNLHLASLSVGGEPVAFDAAASPVLAGDRISYERGALVESYEMSLTSVEQSFVFDTLPGSGDVVVLQRFESELDARQVGEGIELANALGSVRYGRAIAFDAAGVGLPTTTALTVQGIEIRVDGAALARARLPLVIDPVLTTFAIDASVSDDFAPDVAYDAASDRFLCVYEETFSASDHDVRSAFVSPSGLVTPNAYVDFTTDDWTHARVANLHAASQFLAVAEVALPASGTHIVRARSVAANTGLLGAQFTVSPADQPGDKINPEVGGDPAPLLPAHYCVIWERIDPSGPANNHDIHAELVNPDNSLVFPFTLLVDNSLATLDTNPSLSKGNDGSAWNIAWQRQVTASNHDIFAARLSRDGAQLSGPVAIDTSPADDTLPCVSSPLTNGNWLLACQELVVTPTAADHDILGRLMNPGLVTLSSRDLTLLENDVGSGTLHQEQIHASCDSDGLRFIVSYSEQSSANPNDFDVYEATFFVLGYQDPFATRTTPGFELLLSEGHQVLAATSGREDHSRMSSSWSGAGTGSGVYTLCGWDQPGVPGGSSDIGGAVIRDLQPESYCWPGSYGTPGCPCSNPPSSLGRGCDDSAASGGAILTMTGDASLLTDTVVFTCSGLPSTAHCYFMQGHAPGTGFSVSHGVRCVGGIILFIHNAVGGVAIAPVLGDQLVHVCSATFGDPILAGSTRYYQVFYFDPAVGSCSSMGMNYSQAIALPWMP